MMKEFLKKVFGKYGPGWEVECTRLLGFLPPNRVFATRRLDGLNNVDYMPTALQGDMELMNEEWKGFITAKKEGTVDEEIFVWANGVSINELGTKEQLMTWIAQNGRRPILRLPRAQELWEEYGKRMEKGEVPIAFSTETLDWYEGRLSTGLWKGHGMTLLVTDSDQVKEQFLGAVREGIAASKISSNNFSKVVIMPDLKSEIANYPKSWPELVEKIAEGVNKGTAGVVAVAKPTDFCEWIEGGERSWNWVLEKSNILVGQCEEIVVDRMGKKLESKLTTQLNNISPRQAVLLGNRKPYWLMGEK